MFWYGSSVVAGTVGVSSILDDSVCEISDLSAKEERKGAEVVGFSSPPTT